MDFQPLEERPKHLTVISYCQNRDGLFEDIAFASNADADHAFARCQDYEELPDCVRNAGRNVTLLDLVGHGSSAHFRLGDRVFLESGYALPDAFRWLDDVLPRKAVVRILGCDTGVGSSGLRMLKDASQALGRKVLGTNAVLVAENFGERGLEPDVVKRVLVSPEETTVPQTDEHIVTTPADRETATQLGLAPLLEQGYRVLGRGRPLAKADVVRRCLGFRLSSACDGRLVLIEDERGQAPLMLRWPSAEPAPRGTIQRFQQRMS